MADTRKRYPVGQMIMGFKVVQAPRLVGAVQKVGDYNCQLTIDEFENIGKFDRVVKSFFITFPDLNPQPVGKWLYNSLMDRYVFNGWSHYSQLSMANKIDFFKKFNAMVNSHRTIFGSGGFTDAR
ncbi:MAG: hypothetical protein JST36_05725 [Bacteroidetes bacterium]|nr:hypothetical protein [Bacteroidota bacterium]